MKKALLLCVLAYAVSAGGYGQENNRFTGSWDVEIVFAPHILEFTFGPAGTYTVEDPAGDFERLSYTLDTENGHLIMQMDEETSMRWRYRFSGKDKFLLHLTGDDNELMKMLLSGFSGAGEVNELTEELLAHVREAVRTAIVNNPVMRGTRTGK